MKFILFIGGDRVFYYLAASYFKKASSSITILFCLFSYILYSNYVKLIFFSKNALWSAFLISVPLIKLFFCPGITFLFPSYFLFNIHANSAHLWNLLSSARIYYVSGSFFYTYLTVCFDVGCHICVSIQCFFRSQ